MDPRKEVLLIAQGLFFIAYGVSLFFYFRRRAVFPISGREPGWATVSGVCLLSQCLLRVGKLGVVGFPCAFAMLVGIFLAAQFITWFFRMLILWFRFAIASELNQIHTGKLPIHQAWFIFHRWQINPKQMGRLSLILLCPYVTAYLAWVSTGAAATNNTCEGVADWFTILGVIYLMAPTCGLALLAYKLQGVHSIDGFGVKLELLVTAYVALVFSTVQTLVLFILPHSWWEVSGWLWLCVWLVFWICSILLPLSHTQDTLKSVDSVLGDFSAFVQMLGSSDAFFDAFHTFLETEFAAENLLFVREATQMKEQQALLSQASQEAGVQMEVARHLYEQYICSGAPMQINLPSGIFRDLFISIKENRVDTLLWNQAVDNILHLLYLGPMRRFRVSKYWVEWRRLAMHQGTGSRRSSSRFSSSRDSIGSSHHSTAFSRRPSAPSAVGMPGLHAEELPMRDSASSTSPHLLSRHTSAAEIRESGSLLARVPSSPRHNLGSNLGSLVVSGINRTASRNSSPSPRGSLEIVATPRSTPHLSVQLRDSKPRDSADALQVNVRDSKMSDGTESLSGSHRMDHSLQQQIRSSPTLSPSLIRAVCELMPDRSWGGGFVVTSNSKGKLLDAAEMHLAAGEKSPASLRELSPGFATPPEVQLAAGEKTPASFGEFSRGPATPVKIEPADLDESMLPPRRADFPVNFPPQKLVIEKRPAIASEAEAGEEGLSLVSTVVSMPVHESNPRDRPNSSQSTENDGVDGASLLVPFEQAESHAKTEQGGQTEPPTVGLHQNSQLEQQETEMTSADKYV
eukprot:gb/GEZN01002510.1/.p1 GENE.gb/GEZN01002510.1/~~gb/GEZN01002510.1/.p1  ORF type:complete len:799 (-),score=92.61 gb/GEZN01002510.1/:14-2410(-)